MKKKLGIALVVALLAVLTLGNAVLADDPDTIAEVAWDGSGVVTGGANTGDAISGFSTGGDQISGSWTATDSNNDPYGYGVDNFSAYLNASVENGYISAGCERTDSAGMYGVDGQESWSFVGVEDGIASMAYRTTTNFAQMIDASYKNQLPGGHNIVVDASLYEIHRGISDGRGNSGALNAWGEGIAILDCMVSGASGVWPLTYGRGGGCYTDAGFNAIGPGGHVEIIGEGNNSVAFPGMGVSSDGGSLTFIADWLNGVSINDGSIIAD